jgi:hypothetical protein
MFSVLRSVISTRRPEIVTRAKVNLIGSFGGPERTDGVVEAVYGDRACIEWPNGGRSIENLGSLVRIVG